MALFKHCDVVFDAWPDLVLSQNVTLSLGRLSVKHEHVGSLYLDYINDRDRRPRGGWCHVGVAINKPPDEGLTTNKKTRERCTNVLPRTQGSGLARGACLAGFDQMKF